MDTLISQRSLRPLQLNQTFSNDDAFIPLPVLNAYSNELGSYQNSTAWNLSWTLAHGAIMSSTIPDILRSTRAIGGGELISSRARAEMIAQNPVTSRGKAYGGLGIVVVNG